jgi:hypothetical protein
MGEQSSAAGLDFRMDAGGKPGVQVKMFKQKNFFLRSGFYKIFSFGLEPK